MKDYIFFMSAIPHKEINNVENMLQKYIDASASYIIAMETSKTAHKETQGEHLHYAVQMDDKQYDAFRHTCFNNTYKLRGRAVDGAPRQYGKVKQVKDETKFLQYTVKDKNIIYKNIDLKTIQQYITSSYKKVDKVDIVQELMEHLVSTRPEIVIDPYEPDNLQIDKIELEILKYYMCYLKKDITKAYLKTLTSKYMQIYMPKSDENLDKIILQIYSYIKYN